MASPLEEFLKEAGILGNFWGAAKKGYEAEGGLGRAVGAYVPGALATAGGVGIAGAAHAGFNFLRERLTKARDYKAMLQATPDLRHLDASHTQMMYNSLRTLAPTLAKDPLVAGSFVRDALQLSPEHGPAIPPQTAKLLADTQSKLQDEGILGQITATIGNAKVPPIAKPDRPAMADYTRQWEDPTGVRRSVKIPMEVAEARRRAGMK